MVEEGSMSTSNSSHSVRTGSSTGTLQVQVRPNPFDPSQGYEITVTGGYPPYDFQPRTSPPNPPGVQVHPNGSSCHVTVPASTGPGVLVQVNVTDQAGNTVPANAQTI